MLRTALLKEPDPRNQAALAETLGQAGRCRLARRSWRPAGRRPASRGGPRRGAARAVDRARSPVAPRPAGIDLRPERARRRWWPPPCRTWPARDSCRPTTWRRSWRTRRPPVRAAALLSLNVKTAAAARAQAGGARPARRPGAARSARRRSWPSSPSACRRRSRACWRSQPVVGAGRNAAAAIAALCRLPDPRAVSVYLVAIRDRNPRLRRSAESALLAIRDRVPDQLAAAARSAEFSGPAALSLERVLARFEPIREWRVIGPFPRTTPQVFLGERSIDFARSHAGAAGQSDLVDDPPGRAVDRPRRPRRPEARAGRSRRLRLRHERIARPLRLRLRRGRLRPRGPRPDAPGLQRHADRDRQRAGRRR